MGWVREFVVAACAALVVTSCSAGDERSTRTDRNGANALTSSVPTVLILDASGSMTENDAPGPRIDAAKAAAHGLIAALPDDSTIGLETYGTSTGTGDEDKAAGCQDVTVVQPLAKLDRTVMAAAIDAIIPSGYTPISLALQTAADQLPTDGSEQAIVLVSDGEDRCDIPPCDTAAALKDAHPGLTISTVGFKLDGPAADQLGCIADATGGLFVYAANANQLAARLLATQDLESAASALDSNGRGGITLGATIDQIRGARPDFPRVINDFETTVSWRDCDYRFKNRILQEIIPHDGGRTIDGLTPGSSVSEATDLYGDPVDVQVSGGSGTVIYTADPDADTGYKMTVEGYSGAGGPAFGTITSITLCICGPPGSADPVRPVDVDDNTIRNMTFPAGTCGTDSRGWKNTEPITVVNGEGEARDAAGEFAGASIRDAKLVGWLDADGDGTEDAVVSFTCFGSTFDMCCAGRSSMSTFVGVYDFSTRGSPRAVVDTIMPGESPVRGQSYGEGRQINDVRVDGSAIITEETLIYADSSAATAALDHAPDATIEVIHEFRDGELTVKERVVR